MSIASWVGLRTGLCVAVSILFQIKSIVHIGLVRNTRLSSYHSNISQSLAANVDKVFFQFWIYSRFAWVMWGVTVRWCLWKSGIFLLCSFIFKGRVPTFHMMSIKQSNGYSLLMYDLKWTFFLHSNKKCFVDNNKDNHIILQL